MMHFTLVLIPHAQRFIASARAGSYLAPLRKRAVFKADLIEQGEVALLMPTDANLLGYVFVPLCLASIAFGAGLAVFT